MVLKDHLYKQRLHDFCLAQQHSSLQTIALAIKDAEQEAAEYGAPKDRYDGFRNQQSRKRNMLATQYGLTENNIRVLKMLQINRSFDKVAPGALVIINSKCFFIAVGLGMIRFEGEEVAVISAQVPVYQLMRDKKPGEDFIFNGEKLTIAALL